MRAVVGSKITLRYLDLAFRIVFTELLLWALVWQAAAACEMPGWPVANFVVPCVVSGMCQLFVRDVLGGLVGKHTRECARCVQRTAKKHWHSDAAWAGVKTAAGFACAAATIAASRGGLLEPRLIETGAWQVALTSVVVDMVRNPNHPLRKYARFYFAQWRVHFAQWRFHFARWRFHFVQWRFHFAQWRARRRQLRLALQARNQAHNQVHNNDDAGQDGEFEWAEWAHGLGQHGLGSRGLEPRGLEQHARELQQGREKGTQRNAPKVRKRRVVYRVPTAHTQVPMADNRESTHIQALNQAHIQAKHQNQLAELQESKFDRDEDEDEDEDSHELRDGHEVLANGLLANQDEGAEAKDDSEGEVH